MIMFRAVLIIIFVEIAVYTGIVIANHGIDLFPVFFGDILKMEWPGQFNLDFMAMLFLSGLWVAWRHQFSVSGLALGFLAFNLGAPFLSAYLLIASFQTKGDMRSILLGEARAAG